MFHHQPKAVEESHPHLSCFVPATQKQCSSSEL
jgi:hypothetical protein